jgi:hypothetical protein
MIVFSSIEKLVLRPAHAACAWSGRLDHAEVRFWCVYAYRRPQPITGWEKNGA